MGAREETLEALRDGLTSQISRQRGVTLDTTLQYLNQMIGEGKLRRSDILFAIPRETRRAIAEANGARPPNVSPEDQYVVHLYGDAVHALGDMYSDLREVETTLHTFIQTHLKSRLGPSESEWWRKGVPVQIRKNCQVRREEDDEPAAEPYCYTDLLDLGRIIEDNWSSFQGCLSEPFRNNRKQLLDQLRRLNGIRRAMMHPVRRNAPTEDDFDSVRAFKSNLYPTIARELSLLQQLLQVDTSHQDPA